MLGRQSPRDRGGGLAVQPVGVDGSTVTFPETTRSSTLSCPPSYVQSDWDDRYLDALLSIDHAERANGTLVLTGPGISLSYADA